MPSPQMTPEVFRQLAEDARKELRQHHLHDAIYIIKILQNALPAEDSDAQYMQYAEDTFRQLMDKFSAGKSVPASLDEDFENVTSVLFFQLMRVERRFRLANEDSEYCRTQQKYARLEATVQGLAEKLLQLQPGTAEREICLDDLFYCLWTSDLYTSTDVNQLLESVKDMTETECCMVASALTLAIQEHFDFWKMTALARLHQRVESKKARVRAVAGIVFGLLRYHDDVAMLSYICNQMGKIMALPDLRAVVAMLNKSAVICMQAERASEKIKQDILPKIMKAVEDRHMEMGFEEDAEISLNIDNQQENGQQQEKLKSGILELAGMHLDGIDLNSSNMEALGKLPFFGELSHWFLPFDISRSEIDPDFETNKVVRFIFAHLSKGNCDTEVYGMAFLFSKTFLTVIKKQIGEGTLPSMEGETEEELDKVLETISSPSTYEACLNYMQQLYRVFKHYRNAHEFPSPFGMSLNWLENPILAPVLSDKELLDVLADVLHKYERYHEAEAYYNRLIELAGADATILRKAANCKLRNGHVVAALRLYTQADILEPDNIETLRQMQTCYARLEKYEQQLECLLQLGRLLPDDEKVVTQTGLCYIKLQRWQEALQCFFRLELENKHVAPSWRAIGWCSLNLGKHEQAQKYYDRLINSTAARWQDYLNAGHATWLLQEAETVSDALGYYRQYVQHYLTADLAAKDALAPYKEDTPLLLRLGKTLPEINLMHDLLAMEIRPAEQ